MALTPQQLQALYQSISAGQQSAFTGATPGMGQDERNGWINSYGNGGTNYGDYLNWYGNQNGTSGQVGSPTGQGQSFLSSIGSPTGQSYTPGGNFPGQGGGQGSFAAGAGPKIAAPGAPPTDTRMTGPTGYDGTRYTDGPGPGTPGWMQYYTPGNGMNRGGGTGGITPPAPTPTPPPTGGGVTPPSTGITPTPLQRPKSNYSFVSGGWSQPSPWGNAKWG